MLKCFCRPEPSFAINQQIATVSLGNDDRDSDSERIDRVLQPSELLILFLDVYSTRIVLVRVDLAEFDLCESHALLQRSSLLAAILGLTRTISGVGHAPHLVQISVPDSATWP